MSSTNQAMRAYLAARYEMPNCELDSMAADLAEIAQAHRQGLTLNGHQMLDALNSIAPERNAQQLASTVCISHEPTCTAGEPVPPKLYCWLANYPKAGCIELFDRNTHTAQPRASRDVIQIATKLIDCARWVYATPSARKQPDARSLAKVILRLTRPIIDAHVDGKPASTY